MRVRSHLRFRNQLSSQKVTGPSLVSDTCIWAPKTPLSTRPKLSARRLDQNVEQFAALFRGRGRRKAGSQALVRVGGQGELRHQQQFARNLGQAQVHFPGSIWKNAIAEQPCEQPLRADFVIRWPNSHQNQQTAANGTDRFALNRDFGVRNALQQGYQERF